MPTTEDARWLHIRDKFVEAFDSEDWGEAYKSADEWLTAHDARIAPLAAEKALREFADMVDSGPTFALPPSIFSAMAREEADRIAADRLTQEPSGA